MREARVAAIDIGTNSVRLLVARAVKGEEPEWLDRRVNVVRFGQGVDAGGRISEAAMERTVPILAGYREAIDEWGAERVGAVATSASRDAGNRDEAFDRIESALGVRPRLVTGEEEAGLSFRGATAGLPQGAAPFLVVDVGGGSTEFVLGDRIPEHAVSVDIGSVRLTERALPDRPATGRQLEKARGVVDAAFSAVELPRMPTTLVGVAGTFTSLAAIALDLPSYDPEAVHRTRLRLHVLEMLVDRLAGMTEAETAAIPSLDPARAPVLLAGAVVAAGAVRHGGIDEVVVSERDLLDGIVASLLELEGDRGV